MSSNFRTRSLTSAFIVAAIIGMILGGQLTSVALVLLVTGFCAYEIYTMAVSPNRSATTILFVVATMAPLAYAAVRITMGTYRIDEEYFFMIAPLLLFFVFVIVVSRSGALFENTSAMAVSLLLFGCGGLFALTVINKSPILLLCVFILLWTNDTFAYLTGSRFGKNKLAPAISPGKTWEGLIGGLLACILVGIGLSYWQDGISMSSWIAIACMASVFGTSGDLLQSVVKRHFGVKDSGNLLPGHGGFWDRFDSFYGCIPFIAVYLNLFG